MSDSDSVFSGWAVVEVMGHRVVAGFCDHVRVAGVEMLRVTPPPGRNVGDPPGDPQILSAGAIFSLRQCDEEMARRQTFPTRFSLRWDPPALPAADAEDDAADDTSGEDEY